MALNPWRMLLLFLVSGYAARGLLSRAAGPRDFAWRRSVRLLPPLLFGVAVIVTPQPWIEVQRKLGYAHGFGYFLLHDYFDFDDSDQIITPALFHLWFVAYIWAYSLLVAVGAALLPERAGAALQAGFARVFAGWRMVVLPLAWLLLVREAILPGAMPTNRLVDDLPGHLIYLPAFLFGFGLARAQGLWSAILRAWPAALLLAVLGYAGIVWELSGYPGAPGLVDSHAAELGWASLMAWGMILLLLAAAERWLDRDSRWRATLTEAVFPIYLVHQTLIVLLGWWIAPWRLGAAVEAAILFPATLAGCWTFYLIGRRIAWLRPLIGLPFARRRPVG